MTDRGLVTVLGAGSWGTALAILLARNGVATRLWGHHEGEIGILRAERQNRRYLPGIPFPAGLELEGDLATALTGAREVLVAVPSHAFTETLERLAPILARDTGLCWATKGFEPTDGRLLHEVARDCLGREDLSMISGPTFAKEVARGLPTAITVAATRREHARRIAAYLHGEAFRAYTSDDIVGVQVGGAAKNVLAIAAGIADGLGFGANTRAALITRGLAEITRLGLALGAQAETFMGLAGLGDLALTCTDDQSRNRRLGLALARGLSVDRARAGIGQEVEGMHTAGVVWHKAETLGIPMPISEQVHRVLFHGLDPRIAARALLERALKAERD